MPTLVVQRGHVPRRTGATGTAGEQEVVTAIAAELNKYKPDGWKLVVINADEPLERYKGDVFVALHCDGSSNTDAHGASVGYQTAAGSALAQKWKSEYVKQGWRRGFRPDNYTAGLRGYYAYKYAKQFTNTYIVVEHGFLTNAQDAAWIRSHYAECAKAVWMAVAGSVKGDAPVERTYKVMALSTALAGSTERDREFEVKLKDLCRIYGKALFETKEVPALPEWYRGWYRLPL